MRYKWSNIKHPIGRHPAVEYPEIYTTMTMHYDQIKVEINRAAGQVRLELKTLRGEHYESIIKQGVVLREKDLKTGALTDPYPRTYWRQLWHPNGVPRHRRAHRHQGLGAVQVLEIP
jgi:hypothetical protein